MMKPGLSYELVKNLATALNAEKSPAVKDGVMYQFMVFSVAGGTLWVVAMIPLSAGFTASVLLDKVNEVYSYYVETGDTKYGVLFFQHEDPAHLIEIVDHWYHDQTTPRRKDQTTNCN